MVNTAWEFPLPFEGVSLPAPPRFAAITEFAPRTDILPFVSAPLAAPPALHARKKPV